MVPGISTKLSGRDCHDLARSRIFESACRQYRRDRALETGALSRDWDSYIEQKAAREEQQLAAYKNQQKEIASLQLFADRFRAKASKASQAQSKLKQIDRMEKIAAPVARGKTIKFHFPQPVRSGLRVITLKDVDHAYGDVVVYRGMQFMPSAVNALCWSARMARGNRLFSSC